jgi:DNA-binding CsgD family transcriptional regulator
MFLSKYGIMNRAIIFKFWANKDKMKRFFSRQEFIYTLFIILAFSLLIILSSWFMGSMESRHITNDAQSALDTTELNIMTDLQELENILVYLSETVRLMILQGTSYETVAKYMTDINDYMLAHEEYEIYTTGVYGVFDIFGGKFHDGTGWIPPDSFIPKDRPWYKAAVEANGKTAVTEPYISVATGVLTMTFTRRIFTADNEPLGIIGLDIVLDKVRELAVNTHFAHSGYGILMNSQLDILAHPNNALWGKNMTDVSSSFIPIAEDIKQGIPILEHRITNYKGEASVAFTRKLQNGWYVAVIIPENIYFKEMRKMRLVVVIAGTILAATFITLVSLLYKARKKLQSFGLTNLTTRETEIFNLLLTNLSTKEIAKKMELTYSGVNFHIQKLYTKLGVQSRTELLAKFVNRQSSD